MVPVIATRGCPYSCYVYCTYPASQGRKVNHEDVCSLVAKLREIHSKMGSVHVIFRDPVFSINIKYAKTLLRAIAEAGLDLTFTAELHLKNLDDEFCNLARNAGFTWFKVGIESVSTEVRDASGRFSLDNDSQKRQIDIAQRHGIKVDGMFILCQPTDTIETCHDTIKYSTDLGLDMAQFSVFTPYPGTPAFGMYEPFITKSRYEDFSQFRLTYKHNSISEKEADLLVGYAHRRFYSKMLLKKIGFSK